MSNQKLSKKLDGVTLTHLIIMGVAIVSLLVLLVVNTLQMSRAIRDNVAMRLSDIAEQTDDNVSRALILYEDTLKRAARSFSLAKEEVTLNDFLERQTESLIFDAMFIVDAQGEVILCPKCNPGEIDTWLKAQGELPDEFHFAGYDQRGVACSIPLKRNGAREGTLVGIHFATASTAPSLSDDTFRDLSFGFIYSKAQGAVCPAGERYSDASASMWDLDMVEDSVVDIVDQALTRAPDDPVKVDMVDTGNGGTGFIASSSLPIDDWVLLTFMPETPLVFQTREFMHRYWLAVALTVVVVSLVGVFVARGRKTENERVRAALSTDPLTGCLTNVAFIDKAQRIVEERKKGVYAVVFLNPERQLGALSTHYGSEATDEAIRIFHDQIASIMHEGELISRSERSHFFALMRVDSPDSIHERLKTLRDRMGATEVRGMVSGAIDFAQGVCYISDSVPTIAAAQDCAVIAARYYTPLGDAVFYHRDVRDKFMRTVELENSFESSLENGDFLVYLQPKISPTDSARHSAEALVRWNHPKYGLIPPDEFIPLLERNHRICDLDSYVFNKLCETLAEWNRSGLAGVRASVNLSRVCLMSLGPSVIERMAKVKNRYAIPDGQIEIEITESIAFDADSFDMVQSVIDLMHENGFVCSIDDFGFGYSSLSTLASFKPDVVKLDRFFFNKTDDRSWSVVASLIHLLHNLNADVVAEGVEESEQVERLKSLGCDLIQGYYYSPPMPIADYPEWVKVHQGSGETSA